MTAPAQRPLDVAALLSATGINRVSSITCAADVADTFEGFAACVASLNDFERASAMQEAIDHLRTVDRDRSAGNINILKAAVRAARVRTKRAAAVATLPLYDARDPLPAGVDPHTDLASAHRIARDHGADLRHCAQLGGWLAWSDRIWLADEAAAQRRAMDAAIAIMRHGTTLLEQARDRGEQDAADALITWARRAQSEPSIRRALELARHLPPIACSADAWDRDPWLVTCASGTLDLRTGDMGPHRREHMITRLSADPEDHAP